MQSNWLRFWIYACLLLGVLLFFSQLAGAQTGNNPTGSRQAALGGSSLVLADVWASFNNPARLANLTGISVGLNYENRFMLKDLGFNSIAAAFPVRPGVLALAVRQFGGQFYNETFAGIAFGRKFGSRFTAGVRLDGYHIRLAENYGSRTVVSFAAGFSASLNSNLEFGAALFNPLKVNAAKDYDETLPSVFRAGLAYKIDQDLVVLLEAEKDIRYKPTLRSGIEYRVIDIFALRGGIATNPSSLSFGFGLFLGRFTLDVSTVKHEILGYSPNVAIIWEAK